jgi:hypothetical protein
MFNLPSDPASERSFLKELREVMRCGVMRGHQTDVLVVSILDGVYMVCFKK